jgi:hypothetical protein
MTERLCPAFVSYENLVVWGISIPPAAGHIRTPEPALPGQKIREKTCTWSAPEFTGRVHRVLYVFLPR